ncbi:MAG: DUF4358 domain-containing protein [Clostridia bacterium]|nr:DUF4358 domain-containing protein [Clostridia bacterium]
MKQLSLVFISILLIFFLFSCKSDGINQIVTENNNIQQEVNVPCCSIMAEIVSKFDFSTDDFDAFDSTSPDTVLDTSTISYFYGGQDITDEPDFSHVTDYCLIVPITTAATEIGIFKLDDPSFAEQMSGYFNNRASARASTFAPYNQAESDKARNVLISGNGEYVWYIMTDTNNEIQSAILEMIK